MQVDVLVQNGLKVYLKGDLIAVEPKDKITDSLRSFIRTNRENLVEELRNKQLKSILEANPQLKEQFDFEVEERIAIMTIDGKLSENEAQELGYQTTADLWINLIVE
jgi:hypothetical protein